MAIYHQYQPPHQMHPTIAKFDCLLDMMESRMDALDRRVENLHRKQYPSPHQSGRSRNLCPPIQPEPKPPYVSRRWDPLDRRPRTGYPPIGLPDRGGADWDKQRQRYTQPTYRRPQHHQPDRYPPLPPYQPDRRRPHHLHQTRYQLPGHYQPFDYGPPPTYRGFPRRQFLQPQHGPSRQPSCWDLPGARVSMGNRDYEDNASIYYPDYDCDSEGYDEDVDVHHDPSNNSQLTVIVVPPPPPQRSPSCLSMTSHGHSAAPLPAVAAVPSSNRPPTVPSCIPDDDSGEESGLLDELPPPAVISPPCSPYISGEEETLLDDDEEVDSIEEVKKVVASLDAARMTSHDVVENCLSENCGAYRCALVGNKVAPSFPIHLKEIAFICGDLHVRDPTRLNPRSTSLDTDARLIPPRNDTSSLSILGSVDELFVLGWNFAEYIGSPLLIFDGGDEGRYSVVQYVFDPGGDASPNLLLSALVVALWFPP